ncbi:hypothetical protein [Luteibacter yeojuensis]|uniref:Uncharacterized protein n=1 Tax=Luteibacter yeojuensis TaxID=345309 RepID=A0A0F3KMP2_9GAMM|nr:hypothetical protein [Luteibacter yeojuensis]KJV32468.1 hypothetical protein VI08_12015 [Luteibacter yeojuensis]
MNEHTPIAKPATWRSPYTVRVYRVATPVRMHYHVAAHPFSPHRNLLVNGLGALLALYALVTIVSTVFFSA